MLINRKKMFFGILIVLSMELIDLTVLNNILPDIADSFNTRVFTAKIAITSHLISFGIFIPLAMWIATRFGSRTPMIISLIGFVLSSVLCGFSWDINSLVAFRIIQGFFAAIMLPISQTAMIRLSECMLQVSSEMGLHSVASACLGQIIGAIFSQHLSWRYAFFMNVPLGIISLYYVWRYFHVPFPKQKIRLDVFGFITVGLSIGMLFALSDLILAEEVSLITKLFLALSPFLLIWIYCLNYRKIKNPIFEFSLFKNKDFSLSLLVILINRASVYWIFIALPIYLYLYIGYSLTIVAVIMVCIWATNFLTSKYALMVSHAIGKKNTVVLSSTGMLVLMLCWGFLLGNRMLLPYILALIPFSGIMMCFFQTASHSYILSVVSDKHKADSYVISKSLMMIASGLSLSFLGIVYELSKMYLVASNNYPLYAWAFQYSFIVCGILQFVSSLLIYFCRNSRGLLYTSDSAWQNKYLS
ncbi:MFS transporter [Francisellaceae bacterium]|nr:MFS transporter [Francisellaceae bacterium]